MAFIDLDKKDFRVNKRGLNCRVVLFGVSILIFLIFGGVV